MHSQWLLSVVRWAKHLRWCFILKEETTYIFAFRLLAVYIRITSQFTFKLLYTKSMGILFQSFSHTLWHRHLWNNNPYSTTRKFIPFHLFSSPSSMRIIFKDIWHHRYLRVISKKDTFGHVPHFSPWVEAGELGHHFLILF